MVRIIAGYFLLALPFIGFAIFSVKEIGAKKTIFLFITCVAVIACVFAGTWLAGIHY
jgi:hypothetical protein